MHRVTRIGRGAPFRVIDWTVTNLLSHLPRFVAQHATPAFRKLRFGVVTRLPEGVGRIMMRADKVGWQLAFRAKPNEIVDPGVCRGRWPSHLQLTIDRFYRLGVVAIELEIIVLLAAAEGIEVRLVPDFKEPLANFDQAKALDPRSEERRVGKE